MPRIDIELTSASPDGSWTWRAAGARQPRGVLDGAILPPDASVGQHLRVEADYEVDGITVQSVVPPKEKTDRTERLELIPERSFEPVIQQRARPDRGDQRRSDGGGDRRDRRRRPDDGARGGDRPDRDSTRRRDDRARGDRRGDQRDRQDGQRRAEGHDERRHRPHFTPPPELPQRPKPKRLRPGKRHRTEVLSALPDEQRPIAELALQGMSAVRQRLKEDNARLRAEGKPEMPTARVLRLAEDLLPRVRVAEWLDRAEAAQRQLDELDLRDLRSVVVGADDPAVARDESTRELAASLKAALVTKQEHEQQLWLSDVEAALGVGRVIRALRLSSQPPKAGVPFPVALAERLGAATTGSLQPTDVPDRWAAVLEAAAFSPVRAHVTPAAAPEQVTDELRATVTRLAPLLPHVAALFGIDVPAGGPAPRPLRPTPHRRDGDAKPGGRDARRRTDRPQRPPAADQVAASGPHAAPADAAQPETAPNATPADAVLPDPAPPDPAPPDPAPPDAAPPDAAPPDAAPPDAAPPDNAPPDAAPPDNAPPEAAAPDAAQPDTAPTDPAPPAGAPADAAAPDTAQPEAAAPEAAAPDAAQPDTAPTDPAPPAGAPADVAAPDTAQPETAPPDTAPPNAAPPDTAPPEAAALDTAAPETAQPDTAQPESSPANETPVESAAEGNATPTD